MVRLLSKITLKWYGKRHLTQLRLFQIINVFVKQKILEYCCPHVILLSIVKKTIQILIVLCLNQASLDLFLLQKWCLGLYTTNYWKPARCNKIWEPTNTKPLRSNVSKRQNFCGECFEGKGWKQKPKIILLQSNKDRRMGFEICNFAKTKL